MNWNTRRKKDVEILKRFTNKFLFLERKIVKLRFKEMVYLFIERESRTYDKNRVANLVINYYFDMFTRANKLFGINKAEIDDYVERYHRREEKINY